MEAILLKALDSLKFQILPRLLAKLNAGETDIALQDEALINEAIELLRLVRSHSGLLEKTPKEISDDDALQLMSEMDISRENAIAEEAQMRMMSDSENPQYEEISEEEARQRLQEMDNGASQEAVNGDAPAEISDEEARRMLAEMEGTSIKPTDEPTSEISDEEARRMLAEMEGTSASTSMSDEEAQRMLQEMEGAPNANPVPKMEEAPKAATQEAIEEEIVEEVPERGQSEFSADPDMLKDFITNADELMETLDEQILLLEKSPDELTIIEEIFRAAHTLKGACGMFAFSAIERVMHRMENFFDQVRKRKLRADSNSIDVILKALDVVRSLLSGIKENKNSGVKTVPIVKALNALCSGRTPSGSTTTESRAAKSGEGDDHGDGGGKSKKTEQSTIRVDLHRLDALVNLVGELVIDRTRFVDIEEQLRSQGPSAYLAGNMSETVLLFGRHMNEVQDIIMKVRMVPIGNAFNKFPRVVRDLARSLDKEIELQIEGEHTELDKTLVEQIGDPLVHLIRNAVDHGIEIPQDRVAKGKPKRGTVRLSARQEGNQIIITIEDDGKGMDTEVIRRKGIEKGLIREDDNLTESDILNLIFEAGFSTAAQVTNISGRGVGMDVVKKQISKLKGLIDISSKVNKGSKISIQLPLTLAIVQSLLVQTRGEVFAIPLSAVVESIRIRPSEIQSVGDTEVIKRRNMVLPLLYLHEALDLEKKNIDYWYSMAHLQQAKQPTQARSRKSRQPVAKRGERLFVVVVGNAERKFGIVVDTLLNQQEMVIKPLGPLMQNIRCVAGGAILGNGEVVLVLDIAELDSLFRSKVRQVAA